MPPELLVGGNPFSWINSFFGWLVGWMWDITIGWMLLYVFILFIIAIVCFGIGYMVDLTINAPPKDEQGVAQPFTATWLTAAIGLPLFVVSLVYLWMKSGPVYVHPNQYVPLPGRTI